MQFSFTYDSNTYTYLADVVEIDEQVNGEQRRLMDGTMDNNFHDLEYAIQIKGIMEQVPGNTKSANALWHDLLAGADAVFESEAGSGVSYSVVPVYGRRRVVQTIKGTYKESVVFRLVSTAVYQPADSVPTGVAGLMPHLN